MRGYAVTHVTGNVGVSDERRMDDFVLRGVTSDDAQGADLDVTRARELAVEAVDPARSALSRILCVEEVPRRLRRDNPAASTDDVARAATGLLRDAEA